MIREEGLRDFDSFGWVGGEGGARRESFTAQTGPLNSRDRHGSAIIWFQSFITNSGNIISFILFIPYSFIVFISSFNKWMHFVFYSKSLAMFSDATKWADDYVIEPAVWIPMEVLFEFLVHRFLHIYSN